jgi:hypothetical protein
MKNITKKETKGDSLEGENRCRLRLLISCGCGEDTLLEEKAVETRELGRRLGIFCEAKLRVFSFPALSFVWQKKRGQ